MDEKKVREAIERIHKMRDAYNATLRSLPAVKREKEVIITILSMHF